MPFNLFVGANARDSPLSILGIAYDPSFWNVDIAFHLEVKHADDAGRGLVHRAYQRQARVPKPRNSHLDAADRAVSPWQIRDLNGLLRRPMANHSLHAA